MIDTPCIICGEPVISASMGGSDICPACDLGKCRYCGMKVFVAREEIDGGQSKREFLAHIKWHKDNVPGLVKIIDGEHRRMAELWKERKK
jgi:DNA-directed RNA polymerase subunit RPC12/RpoP